MKYCPLCQSASSDRPKTVSVCEITGFQFKREYAHIKIPKFMEREIVFSLFLVTCHFRIIIKIPHFMSTQSRPVQSPNEKGRGLTSNWHSVVKI